MLSKDLQGLYEAYKGVYEETDSITDDLVEEVIGELFNECIEEGYTIDEAAYAIEEAATEYLMELNPYAPAGSKEAKAYQKSTTATKRGEARKTAVKGAVERVRAKASGAKAAAGIAASIAKDEARRAGRGALHAAGKAASAAGSAVSGAATAARDAASRKKEEVKKGVKSLLGRGLRKAGAAAGRAAERLGEETQQLDELSDKKVQKTLKARERRFDRSVDSGAPNKEYHQLRRTEKLVASRNKRTGSNIPVDEEIDTWDVVLEYLITNGHADTNAEALHIMSQLDEEMVQSILEGSYEDRIAANNKKYDANRKRAAQRAADRNAARDRGQTGNVPGVGYVSPRREKETYTDSSGKTRHAKGL